MRETTPGGEGQHHSFHGGSGASDVTGSSPQPDASTKSGRHLHVPPRSSLRRCESCRASCWRGALLPLGFDVYLGCRNQASFDDSLPPPPGVELGSVYDVSPSERRAERADRAVPSTPPSLQQKLDANCFPVDEHLSNMFMICLLQFRQPQTINMRVRFSEL